MQITPTLEEMKSIGFSVVPRNDGRIEIKNRSVSFVASAVHDAYGKPTSKLFWAGYKGHYSVPGWSAHSIQDAINTLINEERHLAYHEGKADCKREFHAWLKID